LGFAGVDLWVGVLPDPRLNPTYAGAEYFENNEWGIGNKSIAPAHCIQKETGINVGARGSRPHSGWQSCLLVGFAGVGLLADVIYYPGSTAPYAGADDFTETQRKCRCSPRRLRWWLNNVDTVGANGRSPSRWIGIGVFCWVSPGLIYGLACCLIPDSTQPTPVSIISQKHSKNVVVRPGVFAGG